MFTPAILTSNPIYEIIDKVTRSFIGLATSLDSVTDSVVRSEAAFRQLPIPFGIAGVEQIGKVNTERLAVSSNAKENDIVAMQRASQNERVLNSTNMDAAGTFFKNTGELLGKLEPVSKQAARLKDVFGIAGDISEGIAGISEIITKEHLTLADGLSAAGKITSGVLGVLEASVLGPEAAVISAAAMVGGSIISYVSNQQQKQEAYTAARQQQYEEAISTFVMDESNGGRFVQQAANISRPPTHKWMHGEDPAREVVRSQGRGAYDLTIPIPTAAVDQMNPRYSMPTTIRYNPADDLIPVKKSYFEEMAAVRNRLMAAGNDGGRHAFLREALRSKELAAEYDKTHGTHKLEKTMLTIKETAHHFVHQANDGRDISNDLRNSTQRATGQSNGGGGPVVINVNRALIEHLTITSTSTKEGVSNMRQQVEEALLEILNSTNIR